MEDFNYIEKSLRTISVHELRLWPLRHGSVKLHEYHNVIRQTGLHAPDINKKGVNTFSYDKILCRNNYIYLEPPRLQGGYGLNSFLLVDPAVLQKSGVRFAIRDIGMIIAQIQLFISDPSYKFPRWIIEPTLLEEIISTEFKGRRMSNLGKWVLEPDIKERLFGSEAFKMYVDRYYLSENEFFAAIGQKLRELNYTLKMYLGRDQYWPLSEEILIPEGVDPEYLLGYWDGEQYNEWAIAKNGGTANRTKYFIDILIKSQLSQNKPTILGEI